MVVHTIVSGSARVKGALGLPMGLPDMRYSGASECRPAQRGEPMGKAVMRLRCILQLMRCFDAETDVLFVDKARDELTLACTRLYIYGSFRQ